MSKPGSTTARGYGFVAHRKGRSAAMARLTEASPCVRCGQPLGPKGPNWHYDHTDDRTGYLGFSHAACNVHAGAVKGNRRQRLRRLGRDTSYRPAEDW